MDYYVRKKTGSRELGTGAEPFSTVQQAAELAAPGDTVWIGEGVYREWVRPRRGGLDEECRIVYRNVPGERAMISGAEPLSGWISCGEKVWKTSLSNSLLADYNPYADEIFGDWYDGFGQVHHTGEVFLDGEALFEVPDPDRLRQPADRRNWFAEVSEQETTFWIYLPEGDPNEHQTEASVRPFCFFPEQEGLGYITVSGLTLENAATQWAPPTAFLQPGALAGLGGPGGQGVPERLLRQPGGRHAPGGLPRPLYRGQQSVFVRMQPAPHVPGRGLCPQSLCRCGQNLSGAQPLYHVPFSP
ncbi:MAG: hypothetical protein ACI4PT_08030 [Candidatus Avoscillospira sp.]